MKNNTNYNNFIITLGTSYSGSGAVHDYLKGRGDLHNPMGKIEYQLPHMPNGLMALEAAAGGSFHTAISDFVITKFEECIPKLCRKQSFWRYGRNYDVLLPSFKILVQNFIDDVCVVNYPMDLNWHRLFRNPLVYFLNELKKYFRLHKNPPNTRLLVSKEKFKEAALIFHDKLFQINIINKPVLLNQAGTGWNPIESTKFFCNRKVILVTRDPRDQFSELKIYKKAHSVFGFIEWYKQMQNRIDKINKPKLLKIKFEDFVLDNEKKVQEICAFLSISSEIFSNYQPTQSAKNINKYKSYLNTKEVDIIEKSLML